MAWVRLEDKFHLNPKVVAAGNAGAGLYVRLLSYCADQLTDGFIPDSVSKIFGKKSEISTLISHKLCVRVDGGLRIPDYLEFNPSREDVLADQATKHQVKVAAGKLGGIASGVARRKHKRSSDEAEEQANGKRNEAPTRPDPTLTTQVEDDETSLTCPASSSSFDDAVQLYSALIADLPRNATKERRAFRVGIEANVRRERAPELRAFLANGLTTKQAADALFTGIGTHPFTESRPSHDPGCVHCEGTGWIHYDADDHRGYAHPCTGTTPTAGRHLRAVEGEPA